MDPSTAAAPLASRFQASPFEEVATGLNYPEAPVWMHDGSLLVVEVGAGRLTRIRSTGEKETVAMLGGGPNGAALGPDGKLYVCNNGGLTMQAIPMGSYTLQVPTLQPEGDAYLGGSVLRVDLQTGAFETVCGNASRSPSGLRGPDDIVFDTHGGFWFTDWGKERATDRDITAVYYVAPGTSQPVVVNERALGRRSAPNGIAISPDGKWLYVAETYARWTRKWELDPQAGGKIIPNPKTFDGSYLHCGAYPCEGRLDSMKVDREGNLYVVTILTHGLDPVSKGGISVVSPEGELQEYLEIDCGVPDPLPSNLCFGGPDGLTMFVTMGGTGRVLKCRMRISGLAAPLAVAAKSAKAASA